MSGGGSGGGGTTVVNPSTSTTVQDIPDWERGYVENLLGQAQTIAAQPYQQFQGPEIAGFTPDQQAAFSNIENMQGTFTPTTQAGVNSAMQGANTAGGIYNAGAGDVNAATGYNPLMAVAPYLGTATGYNSAAVQQPWLGQAAGYEAMAANTATPQGIQSYMSPYTNSVVQGLQNEANLNWNQNIMPGINDKFVGSGQYGSGRNAQVLGQAAGNFQTGLSSNIANALEQGYNTAGNQAAQQASLLSGLGGQSLTGAGTAGNAQSQQVTNLLNQASTAGTATQQQASNLQNAGANLGNLAATQGQQQVAAGTALGGLGNIQQTQGTNYANALQAVGQQQQQLNQSNLTQAMTDWQNQTNWPAAQTQYLNQIIRGLPTPTASTTAAQTPAYSVSPLAGLGGALTAGLGSLVGQKEGGLVGYAEGGMVDDEALPGMADELTDLNNPNPLDSTDSADSEDMQPVSEASPTAPQEVTQNPIGSSAALGMLTPGMIQQQQLLSMARGMLTPTLGGHGGFTALGQSVGNLQDTMMEQQKWQAQQAALQYQRDMENKKIDIQQQNADTLKQYRENGGASMNRVVSVIDPDTKKAVLMPAKEAIEKGLTPTAGFNTTAVTFTPTEIEKAADAIAKGATPTSVGLGYGNNANKTAVYNRMAEKYPDLDLAGAQTNLIGQRAGARTVGTTGGKIEFASESLGQMIPLAKAASEKLDRTQYPSINAIQNAVSRGTGDEKIIALNTYLNAVMADQASLFARSGTSTDAARAKAEQMANAALSKGQLSTYFDSVENEIKAQRNATKGAMATFGSTPTEKVAKPAKITPGATVNWSDF